jgi:hypothetical protein
VLAVGVEGDGGVVTVAQGVAQAGLNRAPGAELDGQGQDGGAGGASDLGGGVGAAIVDHDYWAAPQLPHLADDGTDSGFFVVRGYQNDPAVGVGHYMVSL